MPSRSRIAVSAAIVTVAATILSQTALAHEVRKVGSVQMTVGWGAEPPYTGFRNAVQLFLKDASGKPVIDAGDALKVQVIYGQQKSALLSLDPAFDPDTGRGTPGEYDAPLIPTRPGNYTFHFVGTVHGQRIDQSFTSSEKTFDPVTEAAAVEFPARDPSPAELTGLVERVQSRADAAGAAAQAASGAAAQDRLLAVVGIILGAAGTVIGLWSRRRESA